MGLSRSKASAPTGEYASDAEVLAELRMISSDDSAPLLWEHFLYCDDEIGAASLEARASAAGWTVRRVVPGHHGIVAERSDLPVNADTVEGARIFFEGLADSVPGGDYDGWGAAGA